MAVEFIDEETIAAAAREHKALSRLEGLLRSPHVGQPWLMVGDEHIPVPSSLLRMLTLWLQWLKRGQPVTMVPSQRLLTTQEAADILNVSRPYLARLLDRGDIECVRVGTHRRVSVPALLAYKSNRDTRRRENLQTFSQVGQELETEIEAAER